ncbi:response regulator transcription factor [Microbacterium sp. Marseille-Q6965]|uniref:response regulator transcription factor n=1 Tax=Microbacterium sp. Marseille-Q6965 TaxID=2965072 RepID=UPI0028E0A043|nr:response regulator transcription factor [Microbacterium sp. Marseille-Q6965]
MAVVIEDEPDIRSLVCEVLEQAGFETRAAGTGAEGIALVREHDPVVTTLDVSMPGMDGFEVAKRLRTFSSTYLVMLTARTDEIDTLQGLQSGADDYVTKPFRPRELRARVEAMLRRPRTLQADPVPAAAPQSVPADDEWVEHDGLRVNEAKRIATADGAPVALTRSEFDILLELLSAQGRVVRKESLVLLLRGERHTGGSGYVSESDIRAIEVHVANLRRKLGDQPSEPRWIETVRGIGYRLTAR